MSTIKANNVQHTGSGTVNVALDASGNATVGNNLTVTGGFVPSSSFLRNRIINGDMRIDQRNAGASLTVSAAPATYTVDRWAMLEDTSGVVSVQRVADAPAGFINSAKITATTASGSLTASQRSVFFQAIEGYNISDFGFGTASAQTVTLSFRVKSSLTGQFGGALTNGSNRSYPFSYTINSANTWETKTVTVIGDTTGTWATDNSAGLLVIFSLGAGSNFSGTAGAWAAGDINSATGSVNLMATLNATWQITGVQLEVGSVATPFERRQYGTELALCQRYAVVFGGDNSYDNVGGGMTFSSTACGIDVRFPVPMRASPTLDTFTVGNWSVLNTGGSPITATSIVLGGGQTNRHGTQLSVGVASGLGSAGTATSMVANNTTSARLPFSAEL